MSRRSGRGANSGRSVGWLRARSLMRSQLRLHGLLALASERRTLLCKILLGTKSCQAALLQADVHLALLGLECCVLLLHRKLGSIRRVRLSLGLRLRRLCKGRSLRRSRLLRGLRLLKWLRLLRLLLLRLLRQVLIRGRRRLCE